MSILEILFLFKVIPVFGAFLIIIGVAVSIILASFFCLMYFDDRVELTKYEIKTFFSGFIFGVLMLVFGCMVPNKQDMKFIIATHYVTNIKNIEKLPVNIVNKLNQILEVKDN